MPVSGKTDYYPETDKDVPAKRLGDSFGNAGGSGERDVEAAANGVLRFGSEVDIAFVTKVSYSEVD